MSSQGPVPILHLIHTFDVGGAERQLLTLLEHFDRDRFEHHVGVMNWPGFLADTVRSDADLRFVDFHFRHRSFLPSMWRMVRYQREHGIRVVHAHLHLIGIYARITARLAGTPVAVYTEHSDVGERGWIARGAERLLVPATSLKITVSEEQRRLTREREGFPASKVVTMDNSVPCQRFAPDPEVRREVRDALGWVEDEVVVGILGTLTPRKRVDRFLRMLVAVGASRPALRGLVVGDGPERRRLESEAADLGLGDRVVFVGNQEDVSGHVKAMDVLAITSRWEGLPINMLEAMAAEVPVVATAVGAIPEVLERSGAGLVVAPEDERAIVDALSTLVDDPEQRERRGAAARRYVLERHSAERNCRRLEALYLELLAGNTSSSG